MIKEKKLNINIKLFEDKYLSQALALLNESDHTNRSLSTWQNNSMTAVLAFHDEVLIGIIPFEQHEIKLSIENKIDGLWVSGAYVKPAYRSMGIGSLMDLEIKKIYSDKQIIMVMRHDEGTDAFRWYIKNNYSILSEILSLKMEIKPKTPREAKNYDIINSDEIGEYSDELLLIFKHHHIDKANYPERSIKSWKDRIQFHYYQNFYKFFVILTKSNTGIRNFALLGETSIKDNILRIDILELSCKNNKEDITNIFEKIQHFGMTRNVNELRIQVSKYDNIRNAALDYGFALRWKTNLMYKNLNSKNRLSKFDTRFFQIDYI